MVPARPAACRAPLQNFYGVFDGHGGTAAAEFAVKQLHLSLLESLEKRSAAEADAAMVDAFVSTDKSFLAEVGAQTSLWVPGGFLLGS